MLFVPAASLKLYVFQVYHLNYIIYRSTAKNERMALLNIIRYNEISTYQYLSDPYKLAQKSLAYDLN